MDIDNIRDSKGLPLGDGDGDKTVLLPNGAIDRGDGVVVSDELPLLYESDFYLPSEARYYSGGSDSPLAKRVPRTVDVDLSRDSYFIGFHGPKRGGKTLAMVYFACKAMGLFGMPVWSNFPIAFRWKDRHGIVTEHHSRDLELMGLITERESLNHGLALIDELPLFLNSRVAMSVKNRIIGMVLSQMGKRKLSFFVSAQNPKWIDGFTSWQLDVGVFCQDASKLYQNSYVQRGETILCEAFDYSGQWTGKSYERYPVPHRFKLTQMSKLWTAYKSYEEIDLVEAIRPMAIDLTPQKITDKKNDADPELSSRLVQVIEAVRASGKERIRADDLWEAVGRDDPATRRLFGPVLKSWGLQRKQVSGGAYAYNLAGFVAPGS